MSAASCLDHQTPSCWNIRPGHDNGPPAIPRTADWVSACVLSNRDRHFDPHPSPLPVRWERVCCREDARCRALRCLPRSTLKVNAAFTIPVGNTRPRNATRQHRRNEWVVRMPILARAFSHHPRLRSDDGMEVRSSAIFRIWRRTSGSDSSTSSFAKRTTRYPAAVSSASRSLSWSRCRSCTGPSISMIRCLSTQQKSATKGPMGCWRRNLSPPRRRSRRAAQSRSSAAVSWPRSSRAEGILWR